MSQLQRLVIDANQKQQKQVTLTSEQQHYLKRVLRLEPGEKFIAMDGKGKSWLVQLQENTAEILESLAVQTELNLNVTLLVALPKNKGFEQIVRCCTELGVTKLVPIISDRTLLQPSTNKLKRWRKIAQEAAEQSERQLVPTITESMSLNAALSWVKDNSLNSHKYICVARKDAPHLGQYLFNTQQQKQEQGIVLATGAEGGWTTTEVEQATNIGFLSVSLGKRILRAITAPIMALSLIAAMDEGEIKLSNK
ncbi:MAG: 16S rRNA (uracil(1498)-N(3))-methyltransferase [Spirulinaceae cyanobacterium]